MDQDPKVSCIIITHNRLEYLRRAVESVKKQTYTNIEMIVVDDASDDGTQEYGEELIRQGDIYIYIDTKDSKGGNYARNVGINASAGELIAFLDDDDYWLPNKTEKQVKYLLSHSDVGLVYSGWVVDFGSKLLNYKRLPGKDYFGDIVKKQLYIAPFTSTITLMIKRDVLETTKGFDERLKFWQEYELILRIIQITKIGYIGEALSVANREKKIKRLTNQFSDWNDSIRYILNKHRDLFSRLSSANQIKQKEYYYKEAAYRAYSSGDRDKMKEYYYKAYKTHPKMEYWIRYAFGISRDSTLILESIIMKLVYIKTMKSYC